jgi:hypothetical protein
MSTFQVSDRDNSHIQSHTDENPGAMVLAHSLRDHGTKKRLAVLVTLDTLQAATIEELKVVTPPNIITDLTNAYTDNLRPHNTGRADCQSVSCQSLPNESP